MLETNLNTLALQSKSFDIPFPSTPDKKTPRKPIHVSCPQEFRVDGGRMSFLTNEDSRWGELFLPSPIFPVKEICLLRNDEFVQERGKRLVERAKILAPENKRGNSVYNMYDSSKGKLMLNLDEIYKLSKQQATEGKYPGFIKDYGYGTQKIPTTNELFSLHITEQVLQLAALTRLSKPQAFLKKNWFFVPLDYITGMGLMITHDPLGLAFSQTAVMAGMALQMQHSAAVKSQELFVKNYRHHITDGAPIESTYVKQDIIDLVKALRESILKHAHLKEKPAAINALSMQESTHPSQKPLGLFVKLTGVTE